MATLATTHHRRKAGRTSTASRALPLVRDLGLTVVAIAVLAEAVADAAVVVDAAADEIADLAVPVVRP